MVKNNDSRAKHLRNTIGRLRTGGETEKKFAKVLSGEKANEVLGFVTADAAKNLNVPRKTKITINRNDLLHMDNSGHFSGKGFGRNGHDDARPLSNADISNLKKIIASAQKHEISPTQSRSGMHLLRIVRKIDKNHLVLVRVQKKQHEISLFDAYNITNKKFAEIKKEPATHLAYAERPPIHKVNILQGKEKINRLIANTISHTPPTFKPRQRTKSYWARRSEQRMNDALKYSTSQQKLITRAYTDAQRNLTREVKSLYKNAYKNDQTFDQTKLREIVPNGEISRFKTEMKKAGLKTNLPENYRARANRLELLQAQIRGELQKVAQKENQISAKIHSETLQNSYYKTIFHTAQGFGATPAGKTRNSAAEVPFLSKKQLDEYFGEDTRGWKFRYSKLRDKEIKAIQATFGANNTKNIYRFPEVDLPLGKKTPDILYKKIPVEIKSITSKSSIEHQVESAHKQLDSKGWAIFSADNSKLKKAEIMNCAKLAIQNHGVSGVFVKDGEKIFAVKTTKKELATRPPFGQRLPVHNITISEKREEINNLFGLQSAQPQLDASFSALDKRTINQILTEKFAGKNYSERIWKNTETLAKQLQEILLKNVATGASYAKTARQIRERFKVGKFYAERLARTETAHFENLGEIESYKEMGIEKFQFLATLDKRTSLFCQEMDGKIFKVSEAQPGENLPPLHPNCRSTIVPVFSENFAKNEFRIARNEKGKNIYIDAKTKYADWAKMFEVKKVDVGAKMFAPVTSKTFGVKIPDGVSGYNPNLAENYNKILSEPVGDNFFERLSEKDVNNPYDIPLTRAEIGTYKRLESLGYRVDPIATDRIPKPDFKLFGKQWELKNPIIHENKTPGRLITNTIWKATDKGKLNIWIDATNLNMELNTIIQQAINHMENIHNGNLVEHLIIQRGKKIIQLK